MSALIEEVRVNGLAITGQYVHLLRSPSILSAPRKLNTYSRGGRDGVVLGTPFYEGMIVELELVISAHCDSDVLRERDRIVQRFNLVLDKDDPQTRRLDFVCIDGSIRGTDIIFDSVRGDIGAGVTESRIVQVIGRSEEHFLQSNQLKQSTIESINLGGFAIPFDVPFNMTNHPTTTTSTLTNSGTAGSYPIVTIQGPVDGFVLLNQTTGKQLIFTGELSDSQTLVLDMYNRTAIVNNVTNAIVDVDLTSTWFWLQPGQNEIRLITQEDTPISAEFEWYDAYRGI